jgi:molybdopterin-guanine dinucleotide biosynthesis protein A
LLDTAEHSGCDVLIPRTPGGRDQPLCAVYRRSAREAIEERFQAGIRKVMVGLEELAVDHLEVSEIVQFQNVNTPEDWADYAER